jgi:YbgC/YbaW family acyl-CoA thioester hydrolase
VPVDVRIRRELAWGECDPAGIVYSPTYYRWMDAGSWALLAQGGWNGARVRAEHVTIPLVSSQCDFLQSFSFGDVCEVRSHVSRWGRSSFTVSHEIVLVADGSVLARGTESRVWCRYEGGPGTPLRSEPLPADLRAALGGPAQ